MISLTIEQCRAGRALLNWSAGDLARAAGIGIATVKRFESGHPVNFKSVGAIEVCFEANGVIVIKAGEASKPAGSGVRLLRDPTDPPIAY